MKLKIKRTRVCNPFLSLNMVIVPVLVYGLGKMVGIEYNQYEFVWWILIPTLSIFWFFFNFKIVKSDNKTDVEYTEDYFTQINYARNITIELQKSPNPEDITPESLSLLGWIEWDNPYNGKKTWAKNPIEDGVFPELPEYSFLYDLEKEMFTYSGGEFSTIKIRITNTKDLKEITRLLSLK